MANDPFLLGAAPQTQQGTVRDVALPDSYYYSSSFGLGYETGLVGHTTRWLNTPTTGDLINKKQAEEQFKRTGVTIDIPDEGMPKDKFQYLLERQVYMKQLENDQARRQPGMATAVTGFAASMAPELINPINYIPVVGPARWAAMVASKESALGRAAVRAGLGAVEGGASTAFSEPVNYYFAQALNDDYDVYDSVVNVLGGAAFGSVLASGGGVLADAFHVNTGVLNGLSETDKQFIIQKAAERLARDGDVDMTDIVSAASMKNTFLTPEEAILSPELRRKTFDEGPNAVKRSVAEDTYYKDKQDVKERVTRLSQLVDGLERVSLIQKYKDALDLPDSTPGKANIIKSHLDNLESKYGKDVSKEIDAIDTYKERLNEISVTKNSNKLRRLKLENEKLDAEFGGRLKVAASKDVVPSVERDLFQSELSVLQSRAEPEIERIHNDLNNTVYKEWEKTKQEFSTGQTRTEIDKNTIEDNKVTEILKENKRRISQVDDDPAILQQEIDELAAEDAAFQERTGIKTDPIEDVNIDSITTQSKNYARCLMR